MALAGALKNLEEADASASSSQKKMEAQTKQLERMDEKMDMIDDNLNATDQEITSMESFGFMAGIASFFGGGAAAEDECEKACRKKGGESANDDSEPILKEGWLQKRGPTVGYSWEARWCVLRPTSFVYYTGENKWERKGEIDLQRRTRATSFKKSSAPGQSIQHRGERPCGFALDVDPKAGRSRTIYYFDAGTDEIMESWVEEVHKAAREIAKKAKDEAGESKGGGGDELDKINDVLDGLETKALDIQAEADVQASLVKQISAKVDTTQAKLDEQTKRVKKL